METDFFYILLKNYYGYCYYNNYIDQLCICLYMNTWKK